MNYYVAPTAAIHRTVFTPGYWPAELKISTPQGYQIQFRSDIDVTVAFAFGLLLGLAIINS
ncbi:hypothetical protein L0152_01020 [bacterium]|nr:hypothetical protein [bacterium]